LTKATPLAAYFPINSSYKWSYQVTEDGKTFNQEVLCHKPTGKDKTECDFVQETKSIRKTKYYYVIENNYIYVKKIDVLWDKFPIPLTFTFNPKMPVFSLHSFASDTQQWSWTGSITSLLYKKNLSAVFTMSQSASLKTPLGTFEGIKITTRQVDKHEQETIESWYAKDMGLIAINSLKHKKSILNLNKTLKN
jgi:hypothetical protein